MKVLPYIYITHLDVLFHTHKLFVHSSLDVIWRQFVWILDYTVEHTIAFSNIILTVNIIQYQCFTLNTRLKKV